MQRESFGNRIQIKQDRDTMEQKDRVEAWGIKMEKGKEKENILITVKKQKKRKMKETILRQYSNELFDAS